MKKLPIILLLLTSLSFSGCDYMTGIIFGAATTATSSPVSMALPESKGQALPLPLLTADQSTITVLLYGEDKIFSYQGEDLNAGKNYSYSGVNSFRKYLGNKKSQLGKKIQVYIKTNANASYKNTVNMLDEMMINNIKKYMIVELSTEEKLLLNKLN